MNGEANGTMEEVVKTPNSETIKHRENADSIKAMESEEYENGIEHCDDSKNSYHLQNDNSQGPTTTNNLDSTASDSNNIVQQQINTEIASANITSAQKSVLLSSPDYIYYNDNNESDQHVNKELKTDSNNTVDESSVLSPQNLDNNFNVSNNSGEQHLSSDLAKDSNIAAQESVVLSPQDCNYDLDNNSNDSGQQPANSEYATDNDINAQDSIALSQQDCNNDLDNNCNASNDSGQQPENNELGTDSHISTQQSVVASPQDCNNDLDNNCNASNDSGQKLAKSELATDSNINAQELVVLSPQDCNYDLDNDCNVSNDSSQQQASTELATASNISAKESAMLTPQDFNIELDDNSNDSYPESVSSQAKSEVLEQHGIHIIDEKSKDLDKAFNKKQSTNSQGSYDGTVSIGSDSEPEANDDTSQESTTKNKDNKLSTVGNNIVPVNHLITTEIHEIESDNEDCVVVEKAKPKNRENSMPLRRSRRAIKRKRYTDDLDNCEDDSDVEEPPMKSLRRSKPIVINDTKTLVEMAARQMKSGHSQNQKKEPTVVIIDTNSSSLPQKLPSKAFGLSIKCKTQENLCQNMYNYGTTVTSVSNKANSTNNSCTPTQPSILPSLTDDMFVVEAPSFIVPYVYEKPSLKPFREFVDILGKELEEQKAKADKDLQEKCKAAKEKQEQEKQEKRERGEDVEDSEEDIEQQEASQPDKNINMELDKKKKMEKKERRKRNNDEDDASWDGESSAESDDDIISDEEAKTVIIKEKDDFIDFKDVTEMTAEKVCSTKTDNYFDCSLGKFFVDIGLNLVQEYVQSDLLKQQNRKLYREKKTGHNTKSTEASIASLSKNIEFSKENNAPYKFKYRKCEFCSFKTESMLVLAQHLEIPHMKNNCYKCNFCPFEIRSPNDILRHMEVEHNMRGKLERAPSCHQCVNCPFEDNGKGKLARHQIPCAKKFKPELNLTPPVEWEPPAKIPKISRARNNVIGLSYQNAFVRTPIGNTMSRPSLNISNMTTGMITTPRPRAKIPVPTATRPVTRIFQGGVMIRQTTPVPAVPNLTPKPKSMHQPSISITPLPRQPQPIQNQSQPQPSQMHTKGTFVICEICDGYIKDLEQLRNHMQWIHKVKIHPKMIYNRPPLNCQKCQFRFFTDQGLERHLLGSHGLVTSSMQEAANKGRDAGRCPVCGRVYQWKLLNHVGRDHNLTLKPAHLSYKCTVCTATFSMYKQFENHVYSAHSVVAKRVMDKNKPSAMPHKANNDSLLKPLKINDEITIIPQPTKISLSSKEH